MENRKVLTIGVNGTRRQIQHIIPALKERYNVIDLEKPLEKPGVRLMKHLSWLSLVTKVDVLYNVYTSNTFYRKLYVAKLLKKKVITHWIGTDVLRALEGKTDVSKLSKVDINLACFTALQPELQHLGINTTILPIVPFNIDLSTCPMPKSHAVLIYMPEGKEDHYGYDELVHVFLKYNEIPFYIVGNSDSEKFKNYHNVKVMGVLSLDQMNDLYGEISIVIRFIKHDGLSMSVLEGLAKGKNVIWNYELENVHYARNAEEICNAMANICRDVPMINMKAHEYIMNNFSKNSFLNGFDKVLETII